METQGVGVSVIGRGDPGLGAVNLGVGVGGEGRAGRSIKLWYQSKTMRSQKNVSYDAQLCPIIAKSQRAPNAQLTRQIVDRHYEEHKSCCADSQTLKNPF
jgi:hypothetical protein